MHGDGHGRDEFLPRRPRGLKLGASLALCAHAVLVVGLAFGVRWRTSEPEVMSAELWASSVQQAAPAPVAVEPPPPPPPPVLAERRPAPTPPAVVKGPTDAEIALEKRREAERDEKERLEKAKRDKLALEKKEREKEREKEEKTRKELAAAKVREAKEAERLEKEEEAKLAKQRDDQLKRMQAMAGATGPANATGQALRDAAPSAEYGGRVKARIKPNIVFTSEAVGNPVAEVEVRVGPTGRILGQRLLRSSGNKAWDEAVIRAVVRTEVLPRDVDGRVPPVIVIEFKPNE